MMLCKADFDELFPDLIPPEPARIADHEPVNLFQVRKGAAHVLGSPVGPAFQYGWPGFILGNALAANEAISKSLQGVEGR